MVAIGAGAGMAAVYSVPLGGALFALEVLRGALALRLVVPALAAALIATKTASFVVPNAPLYTVPAYTISPDVYLWTVIASPFIGLWSVVFVRAIAWAYHVRPSGWGRFIAPPFVLAVIGLISIDFPSFSATGRTSPSSCSCIRLSQSSWRRWCWFGRWRRSPRSRAARPEACSRPRSRPARSRALRWASCGFRFIREVTSAFSRYSAQARCWPPLRRDPSRRWC